MVMTIQGDHHPDRLHLLRQRGAAHRRRRARGGHRARRSARCLGFGIRGVPETFFVDRDGVVVAKVTGPVNREIVSLTLERIILGEPVESVRTGEVQPAP